MTTGQSAWLVARYSPVTLFSLRPSITTAAGGQTLLVPTPYAVKLALTDAVIRVEGESTGMALFNIAQPLEVRLRLPAFTVVTHTFNRVRWAARGDKGGDNDESDEEGGNAGPWATRIAYREYCFLAGELEIAFDVGSLSLETRDALVAALMKVTYFGKRGGFFQFLDVYLQTELSAGFDVPAVPPSPDLRYAVVQVLDDLPRAPDPALWERINSFSAAPARLEVHRLVRDRLRALAARRVRSSRTYTLYERTL
jgi:hypothetical protein